MLYAEVATRRVIHTHTSTMVAVVVPPAKGQALTTGQS